MAYGSRGSIRGTRPARRPMNTQQAPAQRSGARRIGSNTSTRPNVARPVAGGTRRPAATQRPAARPAMRQAQPRQQQAQPAQRPAARPAMQQAQRPAQRPAARPAMRAAQRAATSTTTSTASSATPSAATSAPHATSPATAKNGSIGDNYGFLYILMVRNTGRN